MTTNETLFFRDMGPFEALQTRLLPEFSRTLSADQPLRIWSAAASSGQEAYSIAMVLREHGWYPRPAAILGTDISEQILAVARAATYVQFEVNRGLPIQYLVKYFTRIGIDWKVKPEITSMAEFRQFDLRQPASSLGRFHLIFLSQRPHLLRSRNQEQDPSRALDLACPGRISNSGRCGIDPPPPGPL